MAKNTQQKKRIFLWTSKITTKQKANSQYCRMITEKKKSVIRCWKAFLIICLVLILISLLCLILLILLFCFLFLEPKKYLWENLKRKRIFFVLFLTATLKKLRKKIIFVEDFPFLFTKENANHWHPILVTLGSFEPAFNIGEGFLTLQPINLLNSMKLIL